MLETKILINSVISDAKKGAHFMTTDLKDDFLNTPMARKEYMKVPYKYFPEDIRQRYNLYHLAEGEWIYIKIVNRTLNVNSI